MRSLRSSVRLVAALVGLALLVPVTWADVPGGTRSPLDNMYDRPAPNYDLASATAGLRHASEAQLAALATLQGQAAGVAVRWNSFGGSPDVVMDFASASYPGTPEEAGRAFLADHAALFGIASPGDLRLVSQKAALGGSLVRFQQTFGGLDVKDGGVGLVLNSANQVVMASGPYFRDVAVDTNPSLDAAAARAAADADLARFAVDLPAAADDLLAPAFAHLASQVSVVDDLQPTLGVYPTADGYRLVWKVAKFSTNPFGLFLVSVDAHSGEVVERKDFVHFAQDPSGTLPFTADIYPKYPTITQELKDQGIISVGPNGTPLGQERVQLRKFHPTNVATGVNGTLTGDHALVNNALATKLPFAQAALGTWHFRTDNPTGFEARTNERDQLAEPAEHQDEINAFFFVTYLLEYVDYLHRAGDARHGGFGSGAFPDEYPNSTVPLPATVHIPNFYLAIDAANGELPDPTHPDFVQIVLGLDNAVAFNVTSLVADVTGTKSPVVVNPTVYGHGYLFNDLALEGTVPYHEGMHSITSPIAGLEGTEGGALNEGQADMWAFTITDNPSLGDYVVNAWKLRERYRELGRNPDSIAYIRSARSTLKYSDIGTRLDGGVPAFEEHYDGEIYMSTMWDVREMLNRVYPTNSTFKRPTPADGQPTKAIKNGTEVFERLFLGSMYVLGTTAPDTMVKARDAMLVADQMLYSSNPAVPGSPGLHRALIERVFAAHELGVNAREVSGSVATISTQVTTFSGEQPAPGVPQGVTVTPASPTSLSVAWQPVSGALAYEVLKRKVGFEGRRQPNGRREFVDGDAATTGFRHVAYVDATATSYEDRGPVTEIFAPKGLASLSDHEYVVRSIAGGPGRQLGASELSGSARPRFAAQNLTNNVDAVLSNITFAGGRTTFDLALRNTRGADAEDKTVYAPVEFQITSISDATVTVRNADVASPVPTFVYNQNLPLGATSTARRIEFNNPNNRLFTFTATVVGQAYAGTIGGTGTQDGDGSSEPAPPPTYSVFRQTINDIVPLGDPLGLTHGGGVAKEDHYADPTFHGVTYKDTLVTTLGDALSIDARLTSTAAIDLDFELRSADGQTLIARSAGGNANERITSQVQPNTQYVLRVLGWANGPAPYTIVSDQLLPEGSPNENAGTVTPGATLDSNTPPAGAIPLRLQFTVNPLTRLISIRLL